MDKAMKVEDIKEEYLTEYHSMKPDELIAFADFCVFAEDVASLFPVNEDERLRMAKFAKVIWRCSELYHEKDTQTT